MSVAIIVGAARDFCVRGNRREAKQDKPTYRQIAPVRYPWETATNLENEKVHS